MLKRLTQKEVFARDDIHIFQYSTNMNGLKMMDFGALFLLAVGAAIYPLTHFDPAIWMAVPVVMAVFGFTLFGISWHWRRYAKTAYVAYDDEYLIVANDPESAVCIPWSELTLENSGLADPNAGADIRIHVQDETVQLRLFTNLVCIPQFQTVLYTILDHIKQNQGEASSASSE